VIGYYVHHQGRGHLHRARALAAPLGEPVTGLSSLPRPDGWSGEWLHLDRDDLAGAPDDPSARGRLHWVPVGDDGLLRRGARLSAWLDRARPRLVVVDVSVEVALLVRLHGVPVVGVVQPGVRTDPAHLLGYDVAATLVAFWPPGATDALLPGLPAAVRDRVVALGGLSRFPVALPRPRRPGPPRAVVLSGGGGGWAGEFTRAPGWEWTVLGRGGWTDDPRPVVEDADVVVTHAGQNALAEVAAARRPAVVVPQDRPHDEQRVTAGFLRAPAWPAVVEDAVAADHLDAARALDGSAWAGWCDGRAADRFAEVVS
jgi:hypothetical protein